MGFLAVRVVGYVVKNEIDMGTMGDREMNESITCTCGQNNWQWQIDESSRSWIRCRNCGDSMFSPDIGVILINWKATDLPPDWTVDDVLETNQGCGVIGLETER